METQSSPLSLELFKAAETLAEALAACEPFVLYHQAKSTLDGDPAARELIENISLAQSGLRSRQARNAVRQSDVDQLRALQSAALANPVIAEYAQSQQKAIAYLREINQEISQQLGLDFATLARRSSCC
jgi:cell fate (sporulation/competence/biofilm development) regulator YlbF (YheA/YmcA/DUF963 family)